MKAFTLPVSGTRPISEAIVTSGGVDVRQVSPKTMQSKLVRGLYFAGEVLDVDAYTGGYNLSDEYFDRTRPYGKWKDTGLRLEGEAVKSLTATCLEMWNACSRTKEPADRFLKVSHCVSAPGFVQPYEDNPLGHERVAENVYLNLIYSARRSLYITTPYLIITDEMNHAFSLAAKRGVDVRIITPGIPDKKLVYSITRSYYHSLVKNGVRVYEYTPGFCHCKIKCGEELIACLCSAFDNQTLFFVLLGNTGSCKGGAQNDHVIHNISPFKNSVSCI